MAKIDPILTEFKAALGGIYGARLDRVILFGSRARGEARPDSDYDVAVFLKDYADRWDEMDLLADTATNIMLKTGEFIHAVPYKTAQYEDRSPLMGEIRREGLDL